MGSALALASLKDVEVDSASELDGGLVSVVLEEWGPMLHCDEAGGEVEGLLLGKVEELEVLVEELWTVWGEGDEHLARAWGEQLAAGMKELAVLAVVEDDVAEDDDVERGALARGVLAERILDVGRVVSPDVAQGGAVCGDVVFGDVLADVADEVWVWVVCGHHVTGAQVGREDRREGAAGADLEYRFVAHQGAGVLLQVTGKIETGVGQDVAVQRRRADKVDLQVRVRSLREVLGERALGLFGPEALRLCKQRHWQDAFCHQEARCWMLGSRWGGGGCAVRLFTCCPVFAPAHYLSPISSVALFAFLALLAEKFRGQEKKSKKVKNIKKIKKKDPTLPGLRQPGPGPARSADPFLPSSSPLTLPTLFFPSTASPYSNYLLGLGLGPLHVFS